MEHVQNAIIANGYSTTRVVAGRQNLVSGHLVLTVIPGRIRAIRYDQTHKDETHVGRIMAWGNQFPLRAGDILNLHELEQGLENLRRTPTAEAQLEIVPADQPNFSDVVVSWRQRLIPWRLMLSVDDAGNRYTGKYQGNVTIAADNPLGLSDLFYVNFSHDLGHKTHLVDEEGHSTNSRTQGFGLHYSVPFGRWVFAVNHQTYEYHQAIEGLQDNYDYSGKSRLTTLDVRRLLYRDAQRKTHGHLAFWTRENESFIDGVALEVQHRRQTGWTLGFAHQEQLGDLVVDLGLDYKRGTGANQSALSPETGGSHLQLFTWDIALTWPFSVLGQPLSFQSAFHGQHNLTPLTVHDQIAIGGRYTVRGFSGDVTLMAEHGWYWQNTLSWSYLPTHQLYLGLDTGRIGGESADYQLGRTLTGSVFGIRGQWQGWGALYYDAFIGRTLQKPEYFQTDPYTTGFTVTWTF